MTEKDNLKQTLIKTLAPKFEASVLSWTSSKIKNNKIIDKLTKYILKFNNKNWITVDFIKWLHRALYNNWEKILVYRDRIYYHNIPWEWRLHNYKPQIPNMYYTENPNDIDNNILKLIQSYNLIKNKKETDILKLYFDFLAIHPFWDNNWTIASILCDLECIKYWFPTFNILNLRYRDVQFFYYCFEYYERNIDKRNILNEIVNLINNFNKNNIAKEILEAKNKQTVYSTEIYNNSSSNNSDIDIIYQEIIEQEKNLNNFLLNGWKYNLVKQIIWHTFHPYFLQKPKDIQEKFAISFEKHMEILTDYVMKYYIDYPDKTTINFLKWFHKKIYEWIDKVKIKTTWWDEEFMTPWEFKLKQNWISRLDNPKEYLLCTKPELVKSEISNLLDFIDNADEIIYNKSILFFLNFTQIHPFPDDNWKIWMIMTDLILIKNNISPFFMSHYKMRNKRKFFEIIQDYSHWKNTSLKPFYEMILESYSLLKSGPHILKEIWY